MERQINEVLTLHQGLGDNEARSRTLELLDQVEIPAGEDIKGAFSALIEKHSPVTAVLPVSAQDRDRQADVESSLGSRHLLRQTDNPRYDRAGAEVGVLRLIRRAVCRKGRTCHPNGWG